jgi:hypothetical protein
VVWRRRLELNPCRIKFIKNQGVAPWQRSTRARKRNRRAREPRLEHRDFDVAKRPDPMFGRLPFRHVACNQPRLIAQGAGNNLQAI